MKEKRRIEILESRSNIGIKYEIHEGQIKRDEIRLPVSEVTRRRIETSFQKAEKGVIAGTEIKETESGHRVTCYENGKAVGEIILRKNAEENRARYKGERLGIEIDGTRLKIRRQSKLSQLVKSTTEKERIEGVIDIETIESGIRYRIETEDQKYLTLIIALCISKDYISYSRYNIERYEKEKRYIETCKSLTTSAAAC